MRERVAERANMADVVGGSEDRATAEVEDVGKGRGTAHGSSFMSEKVGHESDTSPVCAEQNHSGSRVCRGLVPLHHSLNLEQVSIGRIGLCP